MARQGATAFGGLLNLPAKNLPNPIFAFAIRAGSAKHLTCAHVGHAKTHEWWINELRVNRLLEGIAPTKAAFRRRHVMWFFERVLIRAGWSSSYERLRGVNAASRYYHR